MKAAILAVLLTLFFLGAGAGMAARASGFVTTYAALNGGIAIGSESCHIGYEIYGDPGFFSECDEYGVWEDGSFRLPLIEGCLPGGICN